ncbi:MAG: ribosome-binding factor A [Candidatus Babeliaceae bacterium]
MPVSSSSVSRIKHAQKESLFLRHISTLFTQTALDDDRLKDLFINRVSLSPDKGICTVYFYTAQGQAHFEQVLDILKLYKPSLRKALAHAIKARYTPDLIFRFDEQYEKQQKIEKLLDTLKEDGH